MVHYHITFNKAVIAKIRYLKKIKPLAVANYYYYVMDQKIWLGFSPQVGKYK